MSAETAAAGDAVEAGLADASAREAFRADRAKLEREPSLVAGTPAGSFAGPRDPGGPPELQRLLYPMRAGARWWLPTEPPVLVEAERFETLELPADEFPAWSTRYRIEWLGPHDFIRAWYGPDGFLALALHQEFEGPGGRATIDYTKQLEAIDLVARDDRP